MNADWAIDGLTLHKGRCATEQVICLPVFGVTPVDGLVNTAVRLVLEVARYQSRPGTFRVFDSVANDAARDA